jgi:hypothetical protein
MTFKRKQRRSKYDKLSHKEICQSIEEDQKDYSDLDELDEYEKDERVLDQLGSDTGSDKDFPSPTNKEVELIEGSDMETDIEIKTRKRKKFFPPSRRSKIARPSISVVNDNTTNPKPSTSSNSEPSKNFSLEKTPEIDFGDCDEIPNLSGGENETPEIQQMPRTPLAIGTPKTPKTPVLIQTTKTPRTPLAIRTPKTPCTTPVTESQKTPQTPKTPCTTPVTESQRTPQTPKTPVNFLRKPSRKV